MNHRLSLTLSLVMLGLTPLAAVAQSLPDTENGRYAFSPAADGVLRLDTRSGAVSTCKDNGSGWSCVTAPDERAAFDAEIGRLQTENERLRTQLVQRDTVPGKIEEALPKSNPLVPNVPPSAQAERKIEIPLPSDRDMDRAIGILEGAWRRLVNWATRLQRNADGKV